MSRVIILKNIVFFYLDIFFDLTNSVDPDEMLHNAAFHHGLHSSLSEKYPVRGFPNTKS